MLKNNPMADRQCVRNPVRKGGSFLIQDIVWRIELVDVDPLTFAARGILFVNFGQSKPGPQNELLTQEGTMQYRTHGCKRRGPSWALLDTSSHTKDISSHTKAQS